MLRSGYREWVTKRPPAVPLSGFSHSRKPVQIAALFTFEECNTYLCGYCSTSNMCLCGYCSTSNTCLCGYCSLSNTYLCGYCSTSNTYLCGYCSLSNTYLCGYCSKSSVCWVTESKARNKFTLWISRSENPLLVLRNIYGGGVGWGTYFVFSPYRQILLLK